MSNAIMGCRFDPNGGEKFDEINSLSPLRQGGEHDISTLVQEIATKDFGYKGKDKYTLTLRNKEMILEIWNNADGTSKRKFAKLTLIDNQWQLQRAGSDDITMLAAGQTTARLAQTLTKISNAYKAVRPGSKSPETPEARVDSRPTTPPVIVPVEDLQKSLRELERRVRELESHRETSTTQSERVLERVSSQIEELHSKIERLEREIENLKEENHALQDLKAPLETIATDIPQELKEIHLSIREVGTLLERIVGKSDDTQSFIISGMLAEIARMHAQLEPLSKEVEELNKQKAELLRVNRWLVDTVRELSLKGKEIVDLKQKDEELQKREQALVEKEKELARQDQTIQEQQASSQEELKKLQKELAAARDESKQAQEQLSSQKEIYKKITGELKKFESKIQRLQSELEAASQEKQSAQKENTQATRTIEQLQKDLEKALSEKGSLETLSREQKEELKQAVDNLEKSEERVRERQEALKVSEEKNQQLKHQLEAREQETMQLRQDMEQLSQDHDQDKSKLEDLQLKHEQLLLAQKTLYDTTVETYEKERKSLEAQHRETVRSLRDHNQGLIDQRHEYSEHILTLQHMNANLRSEKDKLKRQAQHQKAQLDSARKAEQVSATKIQGLGVALEEKDKELEQERILRLQAQETAKKTEEVSQKLQIDLDTQKNQLKETEDQLKYTTELLKTRSKETAEAKRLLLNSENDYTALKTVSEELELEQEKKIQELQKALEEAQFSFQEKLKFMTEKSAVEELQKQHESQLQNLNRSLEEAEKAQLESAEKRESAEKLFKEQSETYKQRIESLENEVQQLREQSTLNERDLKEEKLEEVPTIDLTAKEDIKPVALDTTPSSEIVEEAQNLLQVVQAASQNEEKTYQETQLKGMLGNYVVLDPNFAKKAKGNMQLKAIVSSWLFDIRKQFPQAHFSGDVEQTVINQVNVKPRQAQTVPANYNSILGQVSSELEKFQRTLEDIKKIPTPLTLQSIFSSNHAFIAQDLIRFENRVAPLLEQYDKSHAKTEKEIPPRIKEARELLRIVREIKKGLLGILSTNTWVEKKK